MKTTANLRNVWNAIHSPVYLVLDEETGCSVANAKTRFYWGVFSLYVDDDDGFSVRKRDDPCFLGTRLELERG